VIEEITRGALTGSSKVGHLAVNQGSPSGLG